MIEFLHKLSRYLPEVPPPKIPPTIKERLMWTFAAVLIYYMMYSVTAVGVKHSDVTFDFLQMITAARVGSLLTVGIGPIVLASIFLQLFKGAGMIDIDLHDPTNRKKFHEAQKSLAIILAFLEAVIYVVSGRVPLIDNTMFLVSAVILQIAFGAIILFYLDEVISRYGIGSGISLFIAAGVSFGIGQGLVYILFGDGGFLSKITEGTADSIPNALLTLLPFIFTVVVFLVVVYAEGMKVAIPISYQSARGFIKELPLKFFYVSNIPVIFASALIMNIHLFASILSGVEFYVGDVNIVNFLAVVYDSAHGPILKDGLLYYLTPTDIHGFSMNSVEHFIILFTTSTPVLGVPQIIHAVIYILFLTFVSILFGIFWAETNGMDSKSVAEQLGNVGLQIPGYRRDPRLVERILGKYIDPLIIVSSASVGLLAGIADLLGALGTGTGILLTVGILYRFYEELERMNVFEIYSFGGFIGGK